MEKNKVIVMLDNGHGSNTAGKRSPLFEDGKTRLFEYKYCRDIVKKIDEQLRKEGYQTYIVTPETTDTTLGARVRRANDKYASAKKLGKTAFLVSVHNNAAGSGSWMNAQGWSVFVSPNASKNSKNLGGYLFDAAKELGLKTRQPTQKEKYWTANLYICKNTNCPTVLTENFFMDNKKDCEYLLSEKGINDVVKIHVEGIKNYIKNL